MAGVFPNNDDLGKKEDAGFVHDSTEDKINKLNAIIDNRLAPLQALTQENAQKIDGVISELSRIASFIQNLTQQIPAPEYSQPAPVPGLPPMLQGLPPEALAQTVSGLLGGIAQVVAAFKSGGAPQIDDFTQMSKTITSNLLQAGVDGIMQNVYRNYVAVPPQRPQFMQQPPPQTEPQHEHGLA